jgi:hypothetical protein
VGFSEFRVPTRRCVISGSAVIATPANPGRSLGCDQKDSRCWATAGVARVEKGR